MVVVFEDVGIYNKMGAQLIEPRSRQSFIASVLLHLLEHSKH